jgi:hypothetical protein
MSPRVRHRLHVGCSPLHCIPDAIIPHELASVDVFVCEVRFKQHWGVKETNLGFACAAFFAGLRGAQTGFIGYAVEYTGGGFERAGEVPREERRSTRAAGGSYAAAAVDREGLLAGRIGKRVLMAVIKGRGSARGIVRGAVRG